MLVMLKKVPGNINVQKLSAILLLEAGFNTMNKIIVNNRMILRIEKDSTFPMEVVSGRRSQAATHLALNKKLITDIVNIYKLPMVTIYTEVANCYDRVAYLFASLCTQYFRLDESMKIFPWTSHGILITYYTNTEGQPL